MSVPSPRSLLALLVLLSLLTLLLGKLQRFGEAGPELLENGDFSEGLASWQLGTSSSTSLEDGALRLSVAADCEPAACRSSAHQLLPALGRPAHLRLAADATWKDVQPPLLPHARGPRLTLSESLSGEDWEWLSGLGWETLNGTGSARWIREFVVRGDAGELGVWLHFSGPRGELVLDEVSLREVRLEPWWAAMRAGLALGWALSVGLLLWPSIRLTPRSPAHGLVVLTSILLLLGILASGTLLRPVNDGARDLANHMEEAVSRRVGSATDQPSLQPAKEVHADQQPEPASRLRPSTGTIGHFLVFSLFTLALLWAHDGARAATLVGVAVLMAPVSESLQSFTVDRTPGFGDVVLDCAGVGLGFVLWWIGRRSPL